MTRKLAVFMVVTWVASLYTARPVVAAVTLFTDRSTFLTTTEATLVPLPTADQTATSLAFDGVTVTAGGALVGYDVPPLSFVSPTNPPPTSGVIAANGEDDYLLSFTTPVQAVGLSIITNFAANETVTLRDAAGGILFQGSIDNVTPPNAIVFIGFTSSVPIASLFLDTTGGASQNEAIFEILMGEAALPQCETDLAQCEADLTQALGDLTQCTADLSLSQTALTQCSTDLAQSTANLALCTSALGQATAELGQCNTNLAAVQEALAAATADTDQDGRRDLDDACPGTALGAAVDQVGCSLEQFCTAIDATTAHSAKICENSDWQNDEPLMKASEADCWVEKGGPGRADDRCVSKL